jgi:hypothetical protein
MFGSLQYLDKVTKSANDIGTLLAMKWISRTHAEFIHVLPTCLPAAPHKFPTA